jgi:hypothetical protein
MQSELSALSNEAITFKVENDFLCRFFGTELSGIDNNFSILGSS